MKILFLGDILGPSGCKSVKNYLPQIKNKNNIDFVIANGENAADSGVGITEKITKDLLKIDWSKTAKEIHNLIRGLSPVLDNEHLLKDVAICPSAWFYLLVENKKQLRVKLLLSDFEKIVEVELANFCFYSTKDQSH